MAQPICLDRQISRSLIAITLLVLGVLLCALSVVSAQETLPPLVDGAVPQNRQELWAGFDPQAEPLDVEIIKEWEEDGVVLQVLRYRVGIFKGTKAMIAAVFGYPKGAQAIPGLVQIHGGGQYADYRAVLTNAKRGYATISISWAGRISAPDYMVRPPEVKLFWEGATEDPSYKVTTDWGALDGYHAPSRFPGNVFPIIPEPAEWTLDAVKSPRNNAWFLCTMAARRALTFLEKQPQVDAEKLGVYGHSMGGKLTVLTAGSDERVKVAAPSCGGVSDRYNKDSLFRTTVGDDPYLKNIKCPIVFLSPANDFHGRINDLQSALSEIQSSDWRITCAPHHNHQDTPAYEVATQLWFDQYLKKSFVWPKTPETQLELATDDRIPALTIRPDSSAAIASVDVFYTQDADPKADRLQVINRYWHHAPAVKEEEAWVAELPLASDTQPLWAYANVTYELEKPVTGAGYYYGSYTAHTFNVSSTMSMVSPSELKAAKVEVTLRPRVMIENFEGAWEKEWFTYKAAEWPRRTHKFNDSLWTAPTDARLSLQVRSEEVNQLVVGIDDYAAEIPLTGGEAWQTVTLTPSDFIDPRGDALKTWEGIRELRLSHQETLRARRPDATRKVGAPWKGAAPVFRELKWLSKDTAFKHPGVSHSKASIDFIKAKIAADEAPWATAWKKLKDSRSANLDWNPQPHANVERGPYNNPNIGSSEFSRDANAAYVHAVQWALSGEKAHAEKAAEIVNAWSQNLESISNHDARLLVGMEGYEFCNAAELLKHTWDGWPQSDQDRFERMLREVFYPVIKDFYPSANGNWDASMLQTMLAMGVYLDDRAMFDRATGYYLTGPGNGAVRNYFKPSGQCQESGRDQGHTQMGLDFLACACEIAWNQGVDLYGAADNRLLKGFEYTAKYNLGYDVPYEPYRSFEGRYHYKKISDDSRGRLRPMYEKVLNHYGDRQGLETEFTRQATMKLRERSKERSGRRRRSSALGTLMFSGQPDGFQNGAESQ